MSKNNNAFGIYMPNQPFLKHMFQFMHYNYGIHTGMQLLFYILLKIKYGAVGRSLSLFLSFRDYYFINHECHYI